MQQRMPVVASVPAKTYIVTFIKPSPITQKAQIDQIEVTGARVYGTEGMCVIADGEGTTVFAAPIFQSLPYVELKGGVL